MLGVARASDPTVKGLTVRDSSVALDLHEVTYAIPATRGGVSRRLLDQINLSLTRGRSVAVTGQSGVGKSTLLAICLGLIMPDKGTVTVAGDRMDGVPKNESARVRAGHIGMVFQSGELLAELTPTENVALPALLSHTGRAEAMSHATRLLGEVGLDLSDTPTNRLSGGERQRVAVARALINQPTLILADEPTGSLDEQTRDQVADLIFDLPRASKCGLLVVTHDPIVSARADDVLRLDGGRLLAGAA